ncbi:hypothetical protein SAMN05216603_11237 [Pseudomonas benzenivorans]|nr:hypothetical protein [Pseudomonas benzenivorans]SDH69184.1 hypothetical protein SAMN05216603_11237 [Pseudomonas benzenivorans]
MNTKHLLRKLPSCLLGAIFAAGIASTTMVNAVDGDPDPGLFELEGNTTDDAGAGTDWDPLYTESLKLLTDPPGTPVYPDNLITFTTILADPSPQSIYWKGPTKDINDLNEWWYKDGSVPDKDDITNAYAAAFSNPTRVCVDNLTDNNVVACNNDASDVIAHKEGDLIVYFGLDRFANDGDAFAGFWFFQNDVSTNASSQFDGVHKARDADGPGDMLILVEYPQASGAVPVIKIYEWVDSGGDVSTHLDLLKTVSNAECNDIDGKAQVACAITNLDELTEAPAWPYTPKSGNIDNIPFESFFEGGVNVTQLLGSTPCFSSFLAETRASRSETAILKDFVLGNFDVCGAEVTKSCEATINTEGDEVTVNFSGTASNVGGLPLYVELEDSEDGSVITDVCFNPSGTDGVCAAGDDRPSDLNDLSGGNVHTATFTLGAGETVRYEGSYLVTQFDNQIEFSDTVTLAFFEDSSATAPIDTVSAEASCPPVGKADILVTKNCTNPRLDEAGETFLADVSGTVQNVGNVKLVDVTLGDSVFAFADLNVVLDSDSDGVGDGSFTNGGDLPVGAQLLFSVSVSSTTATSHVNTLEASGANFFDATDTDTDSATTPPCGLDLTPDILVVKECDPLLGGVRLVAEGGLVLVEVDNIIKVTNTGDVKLNNVVISDSEVVKTLVVDGAASDMTCNAVTGLCEGSLELGEEVTIKQTYRPDGENITGVLGQPNSVFFNNTATAEGDGAFDLGQVSDTDDASCELCPPDPVE